MSLIEKPTLHALIIEDSQDDLTLVVLELGKEYHVIWHRVETESHLVIALEDNWDVIICDYVLPKFNGERALEIVREQTILRKRSIPFILISGIVDDYIAINLMRKGARDFIGKNNIGRLPLAIQRELRHSGELFSAQIQIEENQEAIIEAWGKAMEIRDRYTIGHTERVTTLSLRLARKLGVSHKDFININRGAYLHDIGKIAIPDMILFKEDVLDFEEMEIMKKHTTYAYDMLKNTPFLLPSIDIPYYHHERWNGSGYPRGLLGANIPFSARLFAVVDVYDALTSDRPYRKSWEKSRAIAYIIDEKNISFDPEIVNAFVEIIGRG